MEQQPFQLFIHKLRGMPHIAERILMELEAPEVDNCLEAISEFRELVWTAFQWSSKLEYLKEGIEYQLSGHVCTRYKGWNGTRWRPRPMEKKGRLGCPKDRFCFGLDDNLWIKMKPRHQANKDNYVLHAYDLPSGNLTQSLDLTLPGKVRPKIRLLPRFGLFLEDQSSIQLLLKSKDCREYVVWPRCTRYWQHLTLGEWEGSVDRNFLADDCSFTCAGVNGNPQWELTFHVDLHYGGCIYRVVQMSV